MNNYDIVVIIIIHCQFKLFLFTFVYHLFKMSNEISSLSSGNDANDNDPNAIRPNSNANYYLLCKIQADPWTCWKWDFAAGSMASAGGLSQ